MIGRNMRRVREGRGLSQTDLGQAVTEQLGKPWSRQAVSAAEKGRRYFTAADLMALARILDTSLPSLLLLAGRDASEVDLAEGAHVPAEEYQRRILAGIEDAGRALTSSDLEELQAVADKMRDSHRRAAEALDGFEASVASAVSVVQLSPVSDSDITADQQQMLRDQYEARTGQKLGPDDIVDWVTGELRS